MFWRLTTNKSAAVAVVSEMNVYVDMNSFKHKIFSITPPTPTLKNTIEVPVLYCKNNPVSQLLEMYKI